MPVLSFDRAVDYYDETRGFAPGAAEKIRDALLSYTHVPPTTRFLELGIGTGRIALPFIEAGYEYDGVDVSAAMMKRLEKKITDLASAQGKQRTDYHCKLLTADITQRLPFEDGAYDVVILVHVLHLVDAWQAVLTEAWRVLRPTGSWLLIAGTERGNHANRSDESVSPTRSVRQRWNDILRELGINYRMRNGVQNPGADFESFLKTLGAVTQTVDLVEYDEPAISPHMMADRLKARMYSGDWTLPDDIHAEAVRRLESWLATEVPDPDVQVMGKGTFRVLAASWAK